MPISDFGYSMTAHFLTIPCKVVFVAYKSSIFGLIDMSALSALSYGQRKNCAEADAFGTFGKFVVF